MNYKVTFYKDEMEMLTERKSNFINKVKSLTSRVFDKLAKETGQTGRTSVISILQHLKKMTDDKKKNWRAYVTLDDYKNIEIPMLPNTGKPIPFKFNFILNGYNDRYTKFDIKGHCLHGNLRGHKVISEIYLEIQVSLGEDFDPYKEVR